MLRHSLGGRGVWGRMDARICMAESLCCPPETILTLLIDYPQYKVESKKKKFLVLVCVEAVLSRSKVLVLGVSACDR